MIEALCFVLFLTQEQEIREVKKDVMQCVKDVTAHQKQMTAMVHEDFFPFVSWDIQYNKITCIHICNWWYKYYIRWQSIKIHWTIILYFSFVRLVIMLLEVVWKVNNWIVSLRLCSYPFLLIFSISLDVFQETQLEQKRADRHSLLKSCKVNLSMIN